MGVLPPPLADGRSIPGEWFVDPTSKRLDHIPGAGEIQELHRTL
jgi:hypothetical protein